MRSRRKPRAILHLHCSGGKNSRLPVVLIHIPSRVQGRNSSHLYFPTLHLPRSGIEDDAGQVPDETFRRSGRVRHVQLAVLQGTSIQKRTQIMLFPVSRERECHGGIG